MSVMLDDIFNLRAFEGKLWGDIQYDEDLKNGLIPPYEPYQEPVATLIEQDDEADALYGWTVPDLSLRKGIWENFPVDVIPMRSNDGTDRYRVCWNDAKIADWRNSRTDSWEEYQEYELWIHIRLMHALSKYTHKYTVEAALDNSMICVLAMVHEPAAETVVRKGPRALDVLKAFPISWDRDGKVHRIKLHRKLAAEKNLKENDVRFDLFAALEPCKDCVVSSAPAGYLCTVTLL
jgi:hypothetical protein